MPRGTEKLSERGLAGPSGAYQPKPTTSAPSTAGPSGLPNISDILKGIAAGGSATATEGVRKLTAKDIANMQANAAAQLAAGLTGPFTPEAEASGYASIAAQHYGVNHPSVQSWVKMAIARNWDADTFGQYLRTRPEFRKTEVGRKMLADILAVIGQTFGRLA